MTFERLLLQWAEIENAPQAPGVYAWYFRPHFTERDISQLTESIAAPERSAAAPSIVAEFLNKHLFDYFTDAPYDVAISGQLKPRYAGKVFQTFHPSPDLVLRIASDPDRLRMLNGVFSEMIPDFSSPLYIGMSDDLHSRLVSHKIKISRMLESDDSELNGDGDTSDHSFAREVVRRGIPTIRLQVRLLVSEQLRNIAADPENLLNRINYPILGKN